MASASRDMIITQTPLRIGLLGGGTDLPDYYRQHGGRVLNCAIDKYVYVIVKQRFDHEIYVNYSKKEIVSRVEDLEHPYCPPRNPLERHQARAVLRSVHHGRWTILLLAAMVRARQLAVRPRRPARGF